MFGKKYRMAPSEAQVAAMGKHPTIKKLLAGLLALMLVVGSAPIIDTPVANAATAIGATGNIALANGGDYTLSVNRTGYQITVASGVSATLTIPADKTVTLNNTSSGGSPISVANNGKLYLVVNGTLKVYGQNAANGGSTTNGAAVLVGANGGYAGISVPTGATLTLSGSGTVYAYGGDAGDGGDAASTVTNYNYAGAGGGGAGAGIGGNGGKGGDNGWGNGSLTSPSSNTKTNWYGTRWGYGGDGAAGVAAGTINIYSTGKVYAYGGGGGTGGIVANAWDGGGGGGYPAAGIGGGGGGGGGGTSSAGGGGFSGGGAAADTGRTYGTNGNYGACVISATTGYTASGDQGGGGYFAAAVDHNAEGTPLGKIAGSGGGYPNYDYVAGAGGAGGKGGTVNIYTVKSNVVAQNGSRITTSTSASQSYAAANATGIYAQLGYSPAGLRTAKVTKATWNATNKTYTFTGGSPSASAIAKTSYGLGIGSGAGYTETGNGTVAIGVVNIDLTNQKVTQYNSAGTATTGTFAQIAAGSVTIAGVAANSSSQLITLSTNSSKYPYVVTGSSTTYRLATAASFSGTVMLNDVTINMSAKAGISGITLGSSSNVTLEVSGTNKIYGGNAGNGVKAANWTANTNGGAAAGAGINVPSGTTLSIVGSGALYAYGGDAGDGGTADRTGGSSAIPADIYVFNGVYGPGLGGSGGGGAGAGIGGIGGVGGKIIISNAEDRTANGNGGTGGAAGTISINARVYAYGGGGGSGGGGGATWQAKSSGWNAIGGGGGGGGGYPAAGIGGGGAGGGAGGSRYNNNDGGPHAGQGGGGGFSGGGGGEGFHWGGLLGNTNGGTNGAGGAGSTAYTTDGKSVSYAGGGGGGGYFSAGTVGQSNRFNTTIAGGAIYGGGAQGGTTATRGGVGGSGGAITIYNKAIVTAQNGSKVTTSTSSAQGYVAGNATAIRSQSNQGFGAGAGYTETNGTTTFAGAPGAPTGVAAALTTATANTTGRDITVTWAPPSNTGGTGVAITGYTLVSNEFGVNRTFAISELTVGTSTVSASLTNMPSNTTGTFTVYAVNGAGTGAGTKSSSVTTKGVPLAPAKIAVVTGEDDHDRSTVYWSAPSSTVNNLKITGYVLTFTPMGQADVMTEEKFDVVEYNGEEDSTFIEWPAETVQVEIGVPYASDDNAYSYMHEVTGLHHGTVYNVSVVAKNAAGNGEPATAQAETVSATSPPEVTVTRVNDAAGAPTGMTVTWTQPENYAVVPEITGFAVERIAKDSAGNPVLEAGKIFTFEKSGSAWISGAVSLTVEGADAETIYSFTDTDGVFSQNRYGYTYEYQVAGINLAGEGLVGSGKYTFEPASPTVTGVTTGIRSVTISWTAPANNGDLPILSYNIYRGDELVGTTNHISMTATHTFIDNELANGASYTYAVAAVNASGVGVRSDGASGSTYGVPGELQTLRLVPTGQDRITVYWTEPVSTGGQPILGYRLTWSQMGVVKGTQYIELQDLQADNGEFTYLVTGLTRGNTYDFEVVAVNAVGDGLMLSDSSYMATTWTVPSFPRELGVESVTDGTGKLKASWAKPTNNGGTEILGYYVYVYTADADTTTDSPIQKNQVVGSDTLEYEISGLDTGTTYQVFVSAYNSVGEGEKANASGTAMNAPYAPTTFTGVTTWSDSVALQWNEANNNGSDIDYYLVMVYTESGTLLTSGEGMRGSDGQGNTTYTYTYPSGDTTKEIIVSYGVKMDGSPDGRYTLSATVDGLEKATTYKFTVAAHNEVGIGSAANTYVRTMSEPFAVTNLQAVPVNESGVVRATWYSPSDTGETTITGYVVSIYEGDCENIADLASRQPLETQTLDSDDPLQADFSGLTDGETYTIKIYAINQIGNGVESFTTVVPRKPAAAPEAFIQLLDGTSADITWIDPTDLGGDEILDGTAGYLISIYDTDNNLLATSADAMESGLVFADAVTAEDGSKTVNIEGFTMGTSYRAVVNVVTGAGLSADSEVLAFTTWDLAGMVTNPIAEATNYSGGVIISWGYPNDDGDSDNDPATNTGNNTGAKDYKIQYRIAGFAEWSNEILWSETIAEGNSGRDGDKYFVQIDALTDGTDYNFRVLVENGAGWSESGAVLTAHPRFAPTAPTIGQVLTGNTTATITSIDLPEEIVEGKPGDGGDDITGYKIYAVVARQDADGQWVATGTPQYKASVPMPLGDDMTPIPQRLTNVVVEGLENGVDYLITVRAMNGACVNEQSGGGLASNAQYVRVGMPLAPENLTVGLGTGNSIVSRYSAAEGNGSPILYYHVYMNGDIYTLEMVNGQLVDTGAAIQFQTLVSTVYGTMMGEEVSVQVSAVNKVGESPLTEAVTVIVGSPTTPVIDGLTMHSDKVSLSWTQASHNGSKMKGYKVYLTDLTDANAVTVFPSAGTADSDYLSALSLEIPASGNLVLGHEYMVQVTSTNLAGESPKSAARYFTFGVPQAPIITDVKFGTGELTATFVPSADTGGAALTGFHVYVNGRPTPEIMVWLGDEASRPEGWVMANAVPGSEPTAYSVVLDGLANGSTYSIQVSSLNQYGESDLSASMSETPATIAGAPSKIKAVATSATEASLTWSAPAYNGGSEITGYLVTAYDAATHSYIEPAEGGMTITNSGVDTTATITGLEKAKGYYFKVQAYTKVADPGVAGISNNITTFDDPGQPEIVNWSSYPMSSGSTIYSLQVEWDEPEYTGGTPILGYNIYSNGNKKNGSVLVTGNTFTINNMQYIRTYSIQIEAVNAVGSSMSESRSIKIGQASAPVMTNIYTEIDPDFGGVAYFEWQPVTEVAEGYALFDLVELGLDDIYSPQQMAVMTSSEVTEAFSANNVNMYNATILAPGANADNTYLTELTIGKTYYFALASYSTTMGVGMATDVYPVTIGASEAPQITVSEPGYNSVELSWVEPQLLNGNTLTGYQLYVDGVRHGDMMPVSQVTSAGENIVTGAFPVDTDLCGKEHNFTITAITTTAEAAQYESLESNTVSLTPWTDPSVIEIEPTDIGAGNASFTVTITKASGNGLDVDGYKVYWNDAAIPASRIKSVDNGDGTVTLTVTGVKNGYKEGTTGYPMYVAAYTTDSDGNIYESPAPDPIPTVATGIPSAPEIRTAVVNYDSTGTSTIILGYVDTEIITGETNHSYRIKMVGATADDSSAWYIETAETTYEITKFNGADLVVGNSYRLSVQAKNDFGYGVFSDEVVVTLGAPKAPLNVNAIPGENMATVTWTAPASNAAPITMYEIHVTGADGTSQIIEIDRNELSGVVSGLDNGVEYTITVVAKNTFGSSVESTACTVTPGTEPSAPINAVAMALSDTQAKVTWDEPATDGGMPITYYIVEGGGKQEVINSTSALEATMTGLTRGQTYTFTIRAYNEIGGSPEVATSNAITTHTLPGKPSWEGITSSDSTIIAMWNPPAETGGSDIVSYTMYISKYGNDGVTLEPVYTIADIVPTEENIDVTRGYITYEVPKDDYVFEIGTEYKVCIAAKNATINEAGAASDNLSVTVVKGVIASIPGVPTNINAIAGDGQVTVEWAAPAYDGGIGIDTYYIYYRPVGTELYDKVSATVNSRSATIKGLTNDITYEFCVSSANSEGESSLSYAATATPIYVAAPNMPDGLRYISNTSSSQITFSWNPVEDAEYYNVYINNQTDMPTAVVQSVSHLEFSAAIGTLYTLEVVAGNEGGISDRAQIKARSSLNMDMDNDGQLTEGTDLWLDLDYDGQQDDIIIDTIPSAPLNVSATVNGVSSINLTWDEPENLGGENLKILEYKVFIDGVAVTTDDPITETSYTMTGITAGKIYTFQIAAVNEIGQGPRSDTLQVYVQASTAPSGLRLVETTNFSTFSLAWDAPTSVSKTPTGYKLQTNGIDGTNSISGTTTTYVGELEKTYVFRVFAEYEGGETSKTTDPLLISTVVPTPVAPTNVTATVCKTEEDAKYVVVEADAVAENVVGYNLYVNGTKVEAEFSAAMDETGEPTDRIQTIYTPETDGEYTIYLTAYNEVTGLLDSGNGVETATVTKTSGKSNIVIVNTADKAEGEPDQVANLIATVTNEDRTQITLTWDAVADVADYTISYAVYEGIELAAGEVPIMEKLNPADIETVINGGKVTCVLNYVGVDLNYYYQVAAIATPVGDGDAVYGAKSNMAFVSTKPDLELPNAPRGITGSYDAVNGIITIGWEANAAAEEITAYYIYGDVDGTFAKLGEVTADNTTYTYTIGEPTQASYLFQVSAVNATGEGDKAAPVTVSVVVEEIEPPTAPDAPLMLKYVFTQDINADEPTASVRVYWAAPVNDDEDPSASASNDYITGYKVMLNNEEVLTATPVYDPVAEEWYVDLNCYDKDYPIEMLVLNSVSVLSVAQVPVDDGTVEAVSGAPTDVFNITYGLNEDTNGDGIADKNLDVDHDGLMDEMVLTITLYGTIKSGDYDAPITFSMSKDGQELSENDYTATVEGNNFSIELKVGATSEASSGEISTFALKDAPASGSSYSLTISKVACTTYTITDIPVSIDMSELHLGEATLHVGELNGDGMISAADRVVLVGNIGTSDLGPAYGDLNGDGSISATDRAILGGSIGKGDTIVAYSAQ